MTIIVHEQDETSCASGRMVGSDLWLSDADFEAATDWRLKPEGLCKGAVCVPLPPDRAQTWQHDRALNASAIWRHMGHPVVHDASGETWVLGTGATNRASRLQSLEAPDFELPSLDGRIGNIAQHRGKKILLATWASW